MNAKTVSVLVPSPVEKAYTYAVPDGMDARPGDFVTMPLGSREMAGVVWDDAPDAVPEKKLKSIVVKHDQSGLPQPHRKFIDWSARYAMNPRGAMLKMTLSVPGVFEEEKGIVLYRLVDWARDILDEAPSPRSSYVSTPLLISPLCKGGERTLPSSERGENSQPASSSSLGEETSKGAETDKQKKLLRNLSPQRRQVLDVLKDGRMLRASEIAEEAGCSSAVVKGLEKLGLIETREAQIPPPCRNPTLNKSVNLSEKQREAADFLINKINEGGYHPVLLDGVTGAGKTEVYFEAIAEALKNNRQALILLPEIALSNAFLDRFQSRFGCAPGLWHSQLSQGQRKRTWRGVADGSTKVIVGARSALYLPYADLGVIIVDEEHDPAYKQEEGTIYHARDMAVVRASIAKIPVVLVTATPSVETMQNVYSGRFAHLELPGRYGGASFPDVEILDMRENRPESQHFIAPKLVSAVAQTLERGKQSLLFLNRRGYAPLTICRSCGHRMECPRCTAWLVEHKARKKLQCHHCGFDLRTPEQCPSCHDHGSLAACGPGVERIYEEALGYWPEARILVLASDTADSEQSLREMLGDIREGRVDIIIGTQIIAKGHHFPGLTCVGVIDADLGLQGGDLRATERTYQLLHQVAGRAGRAEDKGTVYLQTFNPEARTVQALAGGQRDAFLQEELAEREAAHMPPFSRLAGIILAGRKEGEVDHVARELGKTAPVSEGLRVLGPAPAQYAMLRGKHRRRLLLIADKSLDIQKAIASWLKGHKIPSTVKVTVDIDPQSFF